MKTEQVAKNGNERNSNIQMYTQPIGKTKTKNLFIDFRHNKSTL